MELEQGKPTRRELEPGRGRGVESPDHQLLQPSSSILVMAATTAERIILFGGRTATAAARTGQRTFSGPSESGIRRLVWRCGTERLGRPMTLAPTLRPDRSTQNNKEDLSGLLRRIVADACSRRVALADDDADLRRLSTAA